MRAFVQTEIGRFEQRDLRDPEPAAGEVVLRVRCAMTCGTDLKLLSRGHARVSLPVTMGHELTGEVVGIGERVDPSLLGARVVPGVTGPCGECEDCADGRQNLCARGHGDRTWGAFAERLRVPAGVVSRNLHRVPDVLDDESAAFLDPMASVVHGWRRLGEMAPRSSLVVLGTGALAFLWAATARARGIRCTIAGRRSDRADLARHYGAEFLSTAGGEIPAGAFDVAVDATGDPGVWSSLPRIARAGGRVLLFGGCAPGTAVAFDAARLHYGEISLIGSFHSTPAEAAEALALLASRAVDPRPLVSGRGTLGDLPALLEAQARGEGVRYAVFPDGRP